MSFIEDAQSIRSKLHLDTMNPFMLVGVAAIGIVVLVAALYYGSSLFTSGTSASQDDGGIAITAGDSSENQSSSKQDSAQSDNQDAHQNATLFVHVGGAVKTPGLYELHSGARVKDAIDAAGGLSDKADIDSVNLAEMLTDGRQLVIGEKGAGGMQSAVGASSGAGAGAGTSGGASSSNATGKVNINTASASELQSLNGVGGATAQKIIAYRESQGRFTKIEDLKKVSGIGDKKFEALKDYICV